MNFEKLYTVEDIAKMTGLTSRTIRNYIKDGRLNGKKIGVQWRFTEENIKELFTDQDFNDTVENAKNQMVLDYISRKEINQLSSCTIVDYPCSDKDEIKDLCNKVLAMVNDYKEIGDLRFSFQYVEEYKKARFILIGEIEGIQRILNTINIK